MKRPFYLILILLVMLWGCETMGENTKKGAGIGALTGAAIGGIVGHQSGHGWEGALIGGAAGAVGGGVIGNQIDKKESDSTSAVSSEHLSLVRIAQMASSGATDDEIIAEINRTNSTYELTAQSIDYLKNNGVSDQVIDHMLSR